MTRLGFHSCRAALAVLGASTLLAPSLAVAHGVAQADAAFIERIAGVPLIPFIYLGAKHMVTGYDHLLFLALEIRIVPPIEH